MPLHQIFTPEVVEQLNQPIAKNKVAHRKGGGGTELSYIEGHEAIDAANRLFGYGGWGYEIIGEPVRDHYTDASGEIKAMWYTAKVRLNVTGCAPIEELGLVEVQIPRPGKEYTFGQQIDVAMKGAVTDALKRCLRCYGDQFGNGLYDRALVDGQPKVAPVKKPAAAAAPVAAIPAGTDMPTIAEQEAIKGYIARISTAPHLARLTEIYQDVVANHGEDFAKTYITPHLTKRRGEVQPKKPNAA